MRLLSSKIQLLGGGTDSIAKLLRTVKLSKEKVDNVILLSDMMLSDGY